MYPRPSTMMASVVANMTRISVLHLAAVRPRLPGHATRGPHQPAAGEPVQEHGVGAQPYLRLISPDPRLHRPPTRQPQAEDRGGARLVPALLAFPGPRGEKGTGLLRAPGADRGVEAFRRRQRLGSFPCGGTAGQPDTEGNGKQRS